MGWVLEDLSVVDFRSTRDRILEDCKIKLNGWMAEIGRTGRLRVGIFERVGELRALGLKRRWKARRLKDDLPGRSSTSSPTKPCQ